MAGSGNPNRANSMMDMQYRGPASGGQMSDMQYRGPGSVASPTASDLENAMPYGQPAGGPTQAQPMLGSPAVDPRMVMQQAQPMQQSQTPNIFGTASQGMNQGIKTAGMETMYQPSTIAGTDMSQYMNPFENQVVQNTMGDLDRQRQIEANQLGAQASARGAFGGSRDALMQSELSRNFGQQMANTSAQMRQAGYQNAQQMAGQDISTGLAGSQNRQNAATNLGQLSNLGFGQGMALQQQSMQQGALEQGINQLILDAAKNQYAGYTGAPGQALQYNNAALGVTPTPMTTTQTKNPGLFDYLTLAATGASGSNFGR